MGYVSYFEDITREFGGEVVEQLRHPRSKQAPIDTSTFDIQTVQRFVGKMAWWSDRGKVWFTIERAILRDKELAFDGVSRLGGISMKVKHFKGHDWYGECIIFHDREPSVEAFGLPNDKLWVPVIQPRKAPLNEIWIAKLDRVDSFPDQKE